MHELPVVNHILEIVLRHAEKAKASRITAVRLRIGELSELEDEWFMRYFEYVSKGTLAAEATISIERTPVVFRCDGCGKEFTADIRKLDELKCISCGGKGVKLISGREFKITEIEVI